MESPASKTCPRCSEFEARLRQSSDGFSIELHPDIWALQQSAIDGCPLCQLVYHALIFEEPGILQNDDLRGKKVDLTFLDFGPGRGDSSDEDDNGNFSNQDDTSFLILRAELDLYTRACMEIGAQDSLNTALSTRLFANGCAPHAVDLGSAQGVEAIAALGREWLSGCCGSHQRCQHAERERRGGTKPDDPMVPTRLVDVGLEGEEVSPKLVMTHGRADYQEYATLSYAWGEGNWGMQTTSSNVKDLTNCIDTSQLSKTIQHAIIVTRKLGIRYLWVDSLCILQREGPDDLIQASDWQKEAARFGHYYSNSMVTISATGARSSSDGLFLERPGRAISPQPYTIQRLNYAGALTDITIYPSLPRWPSEMRNPPLSKRGWAAQERLISPRILHFACNCVCWECCELEATELYPKEYDLGTRYPKHRLRHEQLERRLRSGSMDLPVEMVREMWYEYVTSYSGKQFTQVSDRLPALSALAARVQGRTKDDYLHGLWRETLLMGLAWAVSGKRWVLADTHALTVPSWSWASGQGSVEFMTRHGDFVPLANVEPVADTGFHDADLNQATAMNQLRATGRMKITDAETLELKKSYTRGGEKTNIFERHPDPARPSWNFHHSLHLDAMNAEDLAPNHKLHFFLLGKSETLIYNPKLPHSSFGLPIGVALALVPTSRASDGLDEFRRVGLLTVPYTEYWADVTHEMVITLV
ncbi:Heterokaryon incompatibility protein (HET) domain containing protein [Naviculisporaceae sp. PSN 640]